MPLGEECSQLCQQHLVVGEDDVFLAAELAEERRPRHPRSFRDLLDRGLVESLLLEQGECRGNDAARHFCGLMHSEKPNAEVSQPPSAQPFSAE